ncbi:MAG: hypothetical protein ABR520_03080 [Mycobacteriales bacterium]|nr:hypothetical protein [Frankia sp.]
MRRTVTNCVPALIAIMLSITLSTLSGLGLSGTRAAAQTPSPAASSPMQGTPTSDCTPGVVAVRFDVNPTQIVAGDAVASSGYYGSSSNCATPFHATVTLLAKTASDVDYVAIESTVTADDGSFSFTDQHPLVTTTYNVALYGTVQDYTARTVTVSPAPVTVTNANNGQTIRLVVGQQLRVELATTRSGDVWQGPRSADAMFLTQLSSTTSGLSATLEANLPAPNTVQPFVISAATDTRCSHEVPACSYAAETWQVSVFVDGSGPQVNTGFEPCDPPAAPVPPSAGTTELTSYVGGLVAVTQGDGVALSLPCYGDPWTPPSTYPADGPLFRDVASIQPRRGSYAHFIAARPGTSTVDSISDARCFHGYPPCARPSSHQPVTVRVMPPGSACLTGDMRSPAAVPYGRTVALSGQATPGASVEIYFRRRGAFEFTRRRLLTGSSAGAYATTYVADEDYDYYAVAGGCTSTLRRTIVTPTISGPALVPRGSIVTLTVRAPNNGRVSVFFRREGSTNFQLRRTGVVYSSNRYETTYRADADYRYYATYRLWDGALRTSNVGLTQVH